ncbi:hypothetical protein TYRP_017913, partial [Tyrophagus putrescentiae]
SAIEMSLKIMAAHVDITLFQVLCSLLQTGRQGRSLIVICDEHLKFTSKVIATNYQSASTDVDLSRYLQTTAAVEIIMYFLPVCHFQPPCRGTTFTTTTTTITTITKAVT